MEQRFSLEDGRLICREEGTRVRVTVETCPRRQGLYRGYLLGREGRYDLGPLMPREEGLGLTRILETADLRRRGCWPILGGGTELTHPFDGGGLPPGWRRLRDPASLFPRDRTLARAAEASPAGMVCRLSQGDFCLAFPWEPGRPFPLPTLFCFARVRPLGSRTHVVFRFRADGRPILPEEEPPLART